MLIDKLLPTFLIRRIDIYIGFLTLFARMPTGIGPADPRGGGGGAR
jgi:hypothetical protein